ncbi:MAG: PIN domain-containing protein [Dehalococcoidia bacterium]
MPEDCVVDTDVLSYLFRRDTRAELFRPYLIGTLPAISFMTIAELDRWILERKWGLARQESMEAFLAQFIVVLVDRPLCRTWAEVVNQARRNGRPIQAADAWIAASAISLGVPLITNNHSDFAGVTNLVILPGEAES